MGYIAQIEAFLSTYPALVAAIGSPLVLLVLGKLFFLGLGVFTLRRVHQITSPDDPALSRVEDIQNDRFPVEERDPEGLLARKIAASNFDMRKRPGGDAATIVLYYKLGQDILAYLTAEYFVSTRTVFFWYIAKSDETPDGRRLGPGDAEMARRLVKALLRTCNRIAGPWRYVIAEVDARNVNDAIKRLGVFQSYAHALRYSNYDDPLRWLWQRLVRLFLRGRKAMPPSVFKVDIAFRMPLHEAGFLFEAEKHETPAWFVVAPRDNTALPQLNGEPVMLRDQVVGLLDTLRQSYIDPDEPAYSAYITRFFDSLAAAIPEHSRLIFRREGLGSGGPRSRRRRASRGAPA